MRIQGDTVLSLLVWVDDSISTTSLILLFFFIDSDGLRVCDTI